MLRNSNKGYTLVETLLVLSTFLLIVTLSVQLLPTSIEKMKVKQFVKQIEGDLYYAQAYAMSHESSIFIYLHNEYYEMYSVKEGTIFKKTVPSIIQFKDGTLGLNIAFRSTGTAIASGVAYIHSEQERYKLTVYVGTGRFKLEKM
jgi:competence protein ComGD